MAKYIDDPAEFEAEKQRLTLLQERRIQKLREKEEKLRMREERLAKREKAESRKGDVSPPRAFKKRRDQQEEDFPGQFEARKEYLAELRKIREENRRERERKAFEKDALKARQEQIDQELRWQRGWETRRQWAKRRVRINLDQMHRERKFRKGLAKVLKRAFREDELLQRYSGHFVINRIVTT